MNCWSYHTQEVVVANGLPLAPSVTVSVLYLPRFVYCVAHHCGEAPGREFVRINTE